ncbi:MAG: class I SAM-dependent methyltransferase [Rhizobiales bacterium]|nr:class I SAM-dependent methyltransferase [Hyphomicrobiales bacterium]
MPPSPLRESDDLYLDLLKRVLTRTLFAAEPDADQDNLHRFVGQHIKHYQQGGAISMLPLARFDQLQAAIRAVVADDVPGDLIETGVWRGGATIFMRAALEVYGCRDRRVWVADSFEGLPEPDPEKYPREAESFRSAAMTKFYNHLAVGLEEVRANFAAFGMLDERVRFLKGWFKDTLPAAPIERLAIMRLDGDYYESTMDALTNLYDRLSVGGYVIVDDYGEDAWTYCRKAVDDFRAARGVVEPMVRVDKPCSYWRKER